jgi:hypothetical protein
VKLPTHLCLVPKLRMVKLYLHSSTHLHRVVFNLLSQSINLPLPYTGDRDSSVGIVTGYGLDGPGSIPGSAIFFSSQRLDWL